jgi:crossover junction endodeoxyribonuclease RuvC
MSSDPTYLGVDPSLRGTGICILRGSEPPFLQTIDPAKLRKAARLAFIRDALLINLKTRTAVFGAIENYSYDSVGRVFQLGEIGGVLRLSLFDQEVTYADVAPAQLKKFATGNSGADKDKVMSAVRDRWSIDVADDNQADACVLAMIARGLHQGLITPTRPQLEVLHALKNPRIKTVVRARKRIKNFL